MWQVPLLTPRPRVPRTSNDINYSASKLNERTSFTNNKYSKSN